MFLFIVRVNLIRVCICAVLKFINQYVFVNSFNRNYGFFCFGKFRFSDHWCQNMIFFNTNLSIWWSKCERFVTRLVVVYYYTNMCYILLYLLVWTVWHGTLRWRQHLQVTCLCIGRLLHQCLKQSLIIACHLTGITLKSGKREEKVKSWKYETKTVHEIQCILQWLNTASTDAFFIEYFRKIK